MRTKYVTFYVVALLLVQTALLGYSARSHSPSWDETGHLAAGISHLKLGKFSLYSVNPPLVRTLAALPVVAIYDPPMDWDYFREDPKLRGELFMGRRMVDLNGEAIFQHIFVARLAVIPICLIGGLVCFFWSRDLFGDLSGCLALTIWTFSPNVLAYGSVISPDMGSTVGLIGASYLFWHWVRDPRIVSSIGLAGAIAFAVLSKSVWVILFPLFLLIWGGLIISSRWGSGDWQDQFRSVAGWRPGVKLAGAFALSLLLVNGFYGFEGSFRRLGDFEFISSAFARAPSLPSGNGAGISVDENSVGIISPHATIGNRFSSTPLAWVPVPLPANMVLGTDMQVAEFERGRYDEGWQAYLLGEWKQGGWWYYYVVGLFFKVPIATWLLVLLGALSAWSWKASASQWSAVLCLWVPAIFFFWMVSGATGMNRHIRYALPVMPVLIIWASAYLRLDVRDEKDPPSGKRVWGSVACCAWLIGSTLFYTPHYLSYFNMAAGGPKNGYKILCDSNIDWGQDLIELKSWLSENEEASDNLRLAYFGSFDPVVVGVDYQLPEPLFPPVKKEQLESLPKGWYVISTNCLAGHLAPLPDGSGTLVFHYYGAPVFEYFKGLEPIDRIGYSMNVYHVE